MVLILVVVEDSLWHDPVAADIVAALIVLILVVVEDSLWRTNTNNTNPNTEKS